MKLSDISLLRIKNQHILNKEIESTRDLLCWMGAMQAQDFEMAKWAIGLRVPNATERAVQSAIDSGEIIRTHVMRPTWHFVSADDAYWMIQLTREQILNTMKSRHKQLGITDELTKKSNDLLVRALSQGKHLIREDLVSCLEKEGIMNSDNRIAHLLALAELDCLICSGANQGKKTTYALFDERVSKKSNLKKEEALALLAKRYFSSHGPATVQDFIWWSGLSATDAKKGLELTKAALCKESVDSQAVYFTDRDSASGSDEKSFFLLPAFDEFIIGYRDRRASLPSENQDQVISRNGIFWPIIVKNGQVIGRWKRKNIKEKVAIEPDFFNSPAKNELRMFHREALVFGKFVEKKVM